MTVDKIKILTQQLFPTGRAFRFPKDSYIGKLRDALAESEARAYDDAKSVLSAVLPDNSDFTTDDATDWERRLGLISNSAVLLSDRKAAILRKINHPGTIPTRQNYRYMERELRSAGFDVYVYENRFAYGGGAYYTKDPLDIGAQLGAVEYGSLEYGEFEYGGGYNNIVANSIDSEKDKTFAIGNNFRSTFFIGGLCYDAGDYHGEIANVDSNRQQEFRQLILKIKPVQTVAFLFIQYI